MEAGAARPPAQSAPARIQQPAHQTEETAEAKSFREDQPAWVQLLDFDSAGDFSSQDVASSTFTPSRRKSNNSSTGKVPRRSGIATITRCTPSPPVQAKQMRCHGFPVSSPATSPVPSTTSIPMVARTRSPFTSRCAFSRAQNVNPLPQEGLFHQPAVSPTPAKKMCKSG